MTRAIAVLTPTLVIPFAAICDMIDGEPMVMLDVVHYYNSRQGRVVIPYESWRNRDEMLVFKEDVTWFD